MNLATIKPFLLKYTYIKHFHIPADDLYNTFTKSFQLKSRQKIYLIVSFTSIVLFFYNILEIKWVNIDVYDYLGLTSHLTFYYWIGLLLITLCSVFIYLDDELKNEALLIFILLIVGLFLFGLGLAEENVRAWSSYYPPAEINYVLETYHVDITSDYPLISYRSWPAFHFISAFTLLIIETKLINLIKYMPFFWVICYVLFTFMIGKRITGSPSQAFLFSFLSITSFWQIYYYYSPQSYAYLALLLLFMLMLLFKFDLKIKILAMLIFLMLTISHLFYGLIMTTTLAIYSFRDNQIKFLIFIVIIFFTWYLHLAPVAFDKGVEKFIELEIDSGIFSQLNKFTPSSPMKSQVNSFRFLYIVIFAVTISTSILRYKYLYIDKRKQMLIKTCFSWILIFSLFGFLQYGAESFERVYMLTILPGLSIIVITFEKLNRNVLIFMMILFVSIHIPAHYGSDSFFVANSSELKGSEFIATKINLLSLNAPPIGIPIGYVIYPAGGDRYIQFYNQSLVNVRYGDEKYLQNKDNFGKIRYIIHGKHSSNFEIYYYGDDSTRTWIKKNTINKNLTSTYDNGGLKLYEHHISPASWVRNQ